MMGYAIRCISGLLHAIGCLAQGDGHTTFSFPLLCLSRILHGYTVLLFPLTVVWIGAREPSEQRAIALAQRNAFSTLGIFFGIVLGSLLASTTSSSLLAGMFPGWLNVIVSIVMLLWISAAFADREPFPRKSKAQSQDGEEEHVPWLHILLVAWAQFAGWVGFVSIEGSYSLMMAEIYGLTHRSVWMVWIPISLLMLLGTVACGAFQKLEWSPSKGARVAYAALVIATFALWYGTHVAPAVGTSAPAKRRLDEAASDTSDTASSNPLSVISGTFDGSLTSVVIGIGLLLFTFALTNTLFNTLLIKQLMPHQQARFQTPVQTLAAVGRGVGPYLGTLIMAYGDEVAHGLGPRLLIGFSYAAVLLSVVVPSLMGSRFYEPPKPPSMW